LNISEAGILLETTDQNAPGNNVTLQIALDDDLVNIRGKVAHCSKGDAGFHKTGIEFVEMDDASLVILKRFITLFEEGNKS
jgi:hypothetical protein